ncbi:MAG TPA: hypothetical protein PKC98_00485, partial [Candidatus Melainabacteria bacterium]|nr:hypothetical protein [Candidatus Melainabacteria bacterium]
MMPIISLRNTVDLSSVNFNNYHSFNCAGEMLKSSQFQEHFLLRDQRKNENKWSHGKTKQDNFDCNCNRMHARRCCSGGRH